MGNTLKEEVWKWQMATKKLITIAENTYDEHFLVSPETEEKDSVLEHVYFLSGILCTKH